MRVPTMIEKLYLEESNDISPEIHPTGLHRAEVLCDDGFAVVFQNSAVNQDFQDFSADMYMV